MSFGGDILDDFDKQRNQPQYSVFPPHAGCWWRTGQPASAATW